ncbi:MAG TPA: hypothetical protein VKF36_18010 [Syntrophorhabdales bacterium]|nr:hypothetical protein [Syntrophorhabdales bacterium]
MTSENVLRIIVTILVIASITGLFVFLRYWGMKKAVHLKPGARIYGLYFWIAIKLFILIWCIYTLWQVRFAGVWVLPCLGGICWSVIMLLFVLHRVRLSKMMVRSENENG